MDYLNANPEELSAMERVAYAKGDTDRAALLAALLELREQVYSLENPEEVDE